MVLAAVILSGCGKPRPETGAPPPSVTVSLPTQEQVPDFIDLTGTVAPSRTVDLVARVTGYLESVHFKEGFFVEAGQLLFVIEPQQYEQQLQSAKATLLRAQSEYDRQVELRKADATSKASEEKWRSDRDQAAAQVELAKLNLSYTRVTAPFAGRIGRRLVDPGNLVGPSVNTKLATLDQLVPIYVNFTLNERDALRIRESGRRRGNDPQDRMGKWPVRIGLQTEEGHPHEGTVDFIDTGISPSTGTVLLRASVSNENWNLFPGLFARVRVPLGRAEPMLVLPHSAIANDQEGDFVLVVGSGDVVVRRAVVKGPLAGGGCAIRSGLNPEDRVIIGGQQKARPGAKVTPITTAPLQPKGPKTTASTSAGAPPEARLPVGGLGVDPGPATGGVG